MIPTHAPFWLLVTASAVAFAGSLVMFVAMHRVPFNQGLFNTGAALGIYGCVFLVLYIVLALKENLSL